MRESLVTPSTRRATSSPNSCSISSRVASVSSTVSCSSAGDDRGAVELHARQDAGDLERMGEIGIAGGAGLRAVRLHREDIGAVERVLVGRGIVGLDPLDQLELADHRRHPQAAAPRRSAADVARAPRHDRCGRSGCLLVASGELFLVRHPARPSNSPSMLQARLGRRPSSWAWIISPSRSARRRRRSRPLPRARPSRHASAGPRPGCSQPVEIDRLVGDLAQRDDRVLVVVAIEGELRRRRRRRARAGPPPSPDRSGWEPSDTQSSTVTRAMILSRSSRAELPVQIVTERCNI